MVKSISILLSRVVESLLCSVHKRPVLLCTLEMSQDRYGPTHANRKKPVTPPKFWPPPSPPINGNAVSILPHKEKKQLCLFCLMRQSVILPLYLYIR